MSKMRLEIQVEKDQRKRVNSNVIGMQGQGHRARLGLRTNPLRI